MTIETEHKLPSYGRHAQGPITFSLVLSAMFQRATISEHRAACCASRGKKQPDLLNACWQLFLLQCTAAVSNNGSCRAARSAVGGWRRPLSSAVLGAFHASARPF